MLPIPQLDGHSSEPLYRQLAEHIKACVRKGVLAPGDRLPATRELAGLLGLNRTTVSAAYSLLEEEGLIAGHVGRGSFVLGEGRQAASPPGLPWEELLSGAGSGIAGVVARTAAAPYSFVTSQPLSELFPLKEFRATCEEVLSDARSLAILQLGSPGGYEPLRRHLLEQARRQQIARAGDEVIVVNGCQQGMDLLARLLIRPGDEVILEDPVYPGLRHVFARSGAHILGAPIGAQGVEVDAVERLLGSGRVRLVVVTPNFQNPTGVSLELPQRKALLAAVRRAGAVLVENDVYNRLRYEGQPLASLKALDETGDTIQVGSFSKIAFPGLRVGWVTGPAAVVNRLVEAKQWTDLHTDQLSQAVLCRFAESGRLEEHIGRIVEVGRAQLRAAREACARHLPRGSSFTRPAGGMNIWVRLPEGLDAEQLLERAQREGVAYLPGRLFTVHRHQPGALRLSFGGLRPEAIATGIALLGQIAREAMGEEAGARSYQPAPAMV